MARCSSKIDWDAVFPHTCKIYRISDEDEFNDGTTTVIYEGKCRDEGNSAMRTYQTNGVMKADHALYIPELITGVTNECLVDITNYNETITGMYISSSQPVKYGDLVGTTVMYNEAKN